MHLFIKSHDRDEGLRREFKVFSFFLSLQYIAIALDVCEGDRLATA